MVLETGISPSADCRLHASLIKRVDSNVSKNSAQLQPETQSNAECALQLLEGAEKQFSQAGAIQPLPSLLLQLPQLANQL